MAQLASIRTLDLSLFFRNYIKTKQTTDRKLDPVARAFVTNSGEIETGVPRGLDR